MKPVLLVISFAMLLVYSALLARVTIVAALFPEEGGGTAQASAGFMNALIFIIVAVVGGALIALLFKYRKKLTLKYLFGGALFLAGTFIVYFFGETTLYLVQIKSIKLMFINYYNIPIFESFAFIGPPLYQEWFYYLTIALFIFLGFYIAYVITSRKFHYGSKNIAVLCEGAFMGAFLAVILPTWTILFLLIGLSLYDIYSVRRGPIRNIVELTMQEEEELERRLAAAEASLEAKSQEAPGDSEAVPTPIPETSQPQGRVPLIKKLKFGKDKDIDSEFEETDFILNSMTYGTPEWDLGIGDLVFYSMLAAHPLSPSFVLYYASDIIDKFGLAVLWLISLFTIIGVLIGFLITLKLLKANTMLPGLPISIGLGLTGFLGSYGVLTLLV